MKFTIFKRITFSFVAIMAFVVFMGGYVIFELAQLNRLTRDIDSIDGATIRLSENLIKTLFSQVGFEKKYILSKDKDFFTQFWQIEEHFTLEMQKLWNLSQTSEQNEMFSRATELHTNYLSIIREEAAFIDAEDEYPVDEYRVRKDDIIEEINRILLLNIDMARTDRDKKFRDSNQITSNVIDITGYTAVVALVVGILIIFFNTRVINRSILRLQEKTREIATGKFEKIDNISSPPEIKDLADDFNIMCERLRELDDMKLDFISHVSHELRTPLTAIKEASSMLLEGTYAYSPEKQHELLSITEEECQRLIESVTRILDLSRMEGKMMEYHFLPCNIQPVIHRSITKLAPIAQSKNILLKTGMPEDLPRVKIDQDRISQVLENLLGNALKFSSEGSQISIYAAEVRNETRTTVEVSVQDTGSGISRENIERIFDKFHRIEDGQATVRGTGLGLPIAKHIVTAHGGKIWADSEAGKGSIFFFTLPAL
jgi:signal transduction histidine kinase